MPTTSILRRVKNAKRFVMIPRKEYEELLAFKKYFSVVQPSAQELRAIRQGRKDIEAGNYTPWAEVKHELANLHNRSRQKRNEAHTKS